MPHPRAPPLPPRDMKSAAGFLDILLAPSEPVIPRGVSFPAISLISNVEK
jgi:hypothetical protein